MSVLNPTPPDRLVDAQGRPYFLWDMDLSIECLRERLRTGTAQERAYLIGKIMRQAKPDDVFCFVTLREIRELWPRIAPFLGRTRPMWIWLLEVWSERREAG